ncbi:hypothetical protein MASR1M46_19690 [Bacteroidales bacterium]
MYKPRDPLADVTKKMLEDFEFAAANVRLNDGAQQINRDVVLAFMSRHMLYFGTFLNIRRMTMQMPLSFFRRLNGQQSKLWQAEDIGSDDYRGIFASENLSANKEAIFYRQYETAKASHALVSYNNTEGQTRNNT